MHPFQEHEFQNFRDKTGKSTESDTLSDEIIKELKKHTDEITVGYRNMRMMEISLCAFKDDIMLTTGTWRGVQKMWNEVLKRYGMKINKKKQRLWP